MVQNLKNDSSKSNEYRNTYVIQQMTKSLIHLMENKSLDTISISELCETAQVGRVSFYRNFSTKEDILKRYIHQLFSAWKEEGTDDLPISDLIGIIFHHFEEHRHFYTLLNQQHLIDLLKNEILQLLKMDTQGPKEEVYAKVFVAYSLYGWIEVWFQRGMKETANEMRQLLDHQSR